MAKRTDQLCCVTALTIAVLSLLAGPGCSNARQGRSGGGLALLTFPSSSLPKNVYLAPWTGSDKAPWMTSNPFLSTNRQVLSKLEEELPLGRGNLTEMYLAAYWVGEPDQSAVEIGLMGLRLRDPATASRAAKATKLEMEKHARLEPHTTPSLIHRGSIVCLLTHTSAVDKDVWSAMVRLVEKALRNVP